MLLATEYPKQREFQRLHQAERLKRADSRYQVTERTEEKLTERQKRVGCKPLVNLKTGSKGAPVETELTKK